MSAKQISFFTKNQADFSKPNVVVTASQASTFAPLVQKRSNAMGWMTTGSVDSDNTTFTVDFGDWVTLTDILLVKHNFKSFTIQYWNGAGYSNFSTPINETTNTDLTTRFSFTQIGTTKLLMTITGTQVADTDKKLCQFIATKLIGKLNGWPIIKAPSFDLNQRDNVMLSGKHDIEYNAGGFNCTLTVSNWRDSQDLSVVETLYASGEGFLVWLSGGDTAQFSSVRKGYRLEDFFFCKCSGPYIPEWSSGLYSTGQNVSINIFEVSN